MARLFRGYEDAFARSVEIVGRCHFSLDELRYEYPEEPVPDGRTPQQYLAELTWAGAAERFAKKPSPPFRGEREGPTAERWEGEVGIGERPGIPHLTPTLSAPWGGEGEIQPVLRRRALIVVNPAAGRSGSSRRRLDQVVAA